MSADSLNTFIHLKLSDSVLDRAKCIYFGS